MSHRLGSSYNGVRIRLLTSREIYAYGVSSYVTYTASITGRIFVAIGVGIARCLIQLFSFPFAGKREKKGNAYIPANDWYEFTISQSGLRQMTTFGICDEGVFISKEEEEYMEHAYTTYNKFVQLIISYSTSWQIDVRNISHVRFKCRLACEQILTHVFMYTTTSPNEPRVFSAALPESNLKTTVIDGLMDRIEYATVLENSWWRDGLRQRKSNNEALVQLLRQVEKISAKAQSMKSSYVLTSSSKNEVSSSFNKKSSVHEKRSSIPNNENNEAVEEGEEEKEVLKSRRRKLITHRTFLFGVWRDDIHVVFDDDFNALIEKHRVLLQSIGVLFSGIAGVLPVWDNDFKIKLFSVILASLSAILALVAVFTTGIFHFLIRLRSYGAYNKVQHGSFYVLPPWTRFIIPTMYLQTQTAQYLYLLHIGANILEYNNDDSAVSVLFREVQQVNEGAMSKTGFQADLRAPCIAVLYEIFPLVRLSGSAMENNNHNNFIDKNANGNGTDSDCESSESNLYFVANTLLLYKFEPYNHNFIAQKAINIKHYRIVTTYLHGDNFVTRDITRSDLINRVTS